MQSRGHGTTIPASALASSDGRLVDRDWHDGEGVGVSSDWLHGGETARAGMIDSIAAENSGRSGAVVVDLGGFQARLLCPSQVCLPFLFFVPEQSVPFSVLETAYSFSRLGPSLRLPCLSGSSSCCTRCGQNVFVCNSRPYFVSIVMMIMIMITIMMITAILRK